VDAKVIAALNGKRRLSPSRFEGRQTEDIFDRNAKLVCCALGIGQVGVNEAFLFRLYVVGAAAAGSTLAPGAPSSSSLSHSPPVGFPAGTRGSSSSYLHRAAASASFAIASGMISGKAR
jgi:hypothetical protein